MLNWLRGREFQNRREATGREEPPATTNCQFMYGRRRRLLSPSGFTTFTSIIEPLKAAQQFEMPTHEANFKF